ncbi:enoyl-CoA hydratase/isomerase family protein [Mesorhizobium sp. KR9-304]|uniref:enoyl-CoA hydratase/isomerase family protein n=1 Tax=Mesorhizobium sp. KR9-304 TaxID=3156614 RepID=UPI0032B40450
MDFGGGDEIRFERSGKAGIVTLTRPNALNALTRRMVNALSAALAAWESDSGVEVVILKAEGRAFCAGGDILEVYKARQAGKRLTEFFADEYRLNAQIDRFAKPYVSLIDGICMGGGVGISAHGSHRVMTENAVFAMPEVGIGFFPDVGGSYVLPNLGGCFGMYLGLTGNKIGYGDALWSGIATHTVQAAYLPTLVEEIADSGDPGTELREFFKAAPRKTDEAALHAIARHFSLGSLQDIVVSLERAAAADSFAAATLATMRGRSPTSLHVTFRAITAGSTMSMDECMKMEFRILNRMLESHDLYEGIRAALIDKGTVPNWQPARLEDVRPEAIDAFFAPLPGGDLKL